MVYETRPLVQVCESECNVKTRKLKDVCFNLRHRHLRLPKSITISMLIRKMKTSHFSKISPAFNNLALVYKTTYMIASSWSCRTSDFGYVVMLPQAQTWACFSWHISLFLHGRTSQLLFLFAQIMSRSKPAVEAGAASGGAKSVKKKAQVPKLEEFVDGRDYSGAIALLEFERSSGKSSRDRDQWLAYCSFHLGNYRRAMEVSIVQCFWNPWSWTLMDSSSHIMYVS